MADTILAALDNRRQIEPAGTSLEEAYATSEALMASRVARGEQPAGWKIGFTNRTIWEEYGVHQPIWGPMYRHTIRSCGPDAATELAASDFMEPRIEPEIFFRIGRSPRAGMNDVELLSCVEAVGHGFEIVQCVYPDWRFSVADTVAAAALHGAFVHGPLVPIDHAADADEWVERLATFSIVLSRNGEEVDRGVAANVLDGPLVALRHFADGLAARPMARGIEAGDLVTTGTVTRAFPVGAGDTWSTRVEGLPLPGMRLTFR